MYDPFKHIDEMLTHFVSEELRDIIHLVVTIAISYLVGKSTSKTPKTWTLWLIVAVLLLIFLAGSAIEAHRNSGFNSGALFVIDFVLSLLLAIAIVYPFIKKSLPNGSKRLDWAKDRSLWITETSPEGAAAIILSPKGLQFRAQFTGKQPRWAKMEIVLKEEDYRDWAGISFDIKCDHPYPDTHIRLEVKVPSVSGDGSGSIYRVKKPVSDLNIGRSIFLFQEMCQPDWSLENDWGYLNLQKIISVAVVCNTTCDAVEFYVNNFALVKFTDIPS